jgi:hypothetical protein
VKVIDPDHYRWRTGRAVIGGQIWDAAISLQEGNPVTLDTKGGWDYLEAWVGLDERENSFGATLSVAGDGQRLGTYHVSLGDPARFIAVPLQSARSIKLGVRSDISGTTNIASLALANARLIRGVTKPSHPMDLYVNDGQTVFIEQPGDYKIHVRQP